MTNSTQGNKTLPQLTPIAAITTGMLFHCWDPTQPVGSRDGAFPVNLLLNTSFPQSANVVFAGPTTGPSAAPSFRSLVAADLPTVPVTKGGTGLATLTAHAVLLGEGTSNVALAAPGASGQMLLSQGAAADPAFGNNAVISGGTVDNTPVGATTPSSGAFTTLAASTAMGVASGGTGRATLTAHGVLLGEGTSAINQTSAGTTGQVLTSGGASADPTWGNPGQPYFQAYRSSSQSVTVNTATKVQFDTKSFDSNSAYDNTTNFRFTPQVAGKYKVTAEINMSASAVNGAQQIVCSIYKNGASFIGGGNSIVTPSSTGTQMAKTASATISMNGSTDFLEIFATLTAGTSPTVNGGSAPIVTWFEAQYIGP